MSSRTKSDIRKIVRELHSDIMRWPVVWPTDSVLPILAYAYHFEVLKEPEPSLFEPDKPQWPFRRPAQEMLNHLLPEAISSDIKDELEAKVSSVSLGHHIQVAKNLARHDLSDSDFQLCFTELIQVSNQDQTHVLISKEILEYSLALFSALFSAVNPRIYISGPALLSPELNVGRNSVDHWIFDDPLAAIWHHISRIVFRWAGTVSYSKPENSFELGLFGAEQVETFDHFIAFPPTRSDLFQFIDFEKAAQWFGTRSTGIFILPENMISAHRTVPSLVDNNLLRSVSKIPFRIGQRGSNALLLMTGQADLFSEDIRFFDAEPFLETLSPSQSNPVGSIESVAVFNAESAVSTLLDDDNEFVAKVSPEKVANCDYNLKPARYLLDKPLEVPDGFTEVYLGSFLSTDDEKEALPPEGGYVCSSLSKLRSRGFLYTDLNLKENSLNVVRVDRDCLLISTTMRKSIPETAIFRFRGTPIYVTSKIVPLFPDATIDISWLQEEFSQQYVVQQLRMYEQGSSIQRISLNDLSQISLLAPPKDQQRHLVERLREAEVGEETWFKSLLEAERQRSQDGLKIKKHGLSQPLAALKSRLKMLKSFINSNESVTASDVISHDGTNLAKYIEQGLEECLELGILVEALTEKTELGIPAPQRLEALQSAIESKFASDSRFSIQIDRIDAEGSDHDADVVPIVQIAIEDFEEAVMNIIQNACKHGFAEKKASDCRIRVDFEDTNAEEICLRIRNTGRPFPERMTTRRFTLKDEKGKGSTGTGLGGYRIQQIMQHVGGRVEIYHGDAEYAAGISLYFRKEYE